MKRPDLSIIVPVCNGSAFLPDCLAALTAQMDPLVEIIVVDDASTDDSASIADRKGIRLIRLLRNLGPAAARNAGVRASRGGIILFIDADVRIAPGAVRRVRDHFAQHPEDAALIGSYDSTPTAPGIVSQYRNLLHHFVHQHADLEVSHFWTGIGAVRRTAFDAVGGFDEAFRSIEDVEFGYRLRRNGFRIVIDKRLQGTHLKRWTLPGMVRTDIFNRAVPWTRLLHSSRCIPGDLSLSSGARLSTAAAGTFIVSLGFLPIHPASGGMALLAFTAFILLNSSLMRFLLRYRGPIFAVTSIWLHLIYTLSVGTAFAITSIACTAGSFLGFDHQFKNGALHEYLRKSGRS